MLFESVPPFHVPSAASKYLPVEFPLVDGVIKIFPPPGPVSPTAYVTVMVIADDVAAAYVESAAIVAVIEHVPAVTNVTTPVKDPTVHTDVVELAYDLVPLPPVTELSRVGGVANLL